MIIVESYTRILIFPHKYSHAEHRLAFLIVHSSITGYGSESEGTLYLVGAGGWVRFASPNVIIQTGPWPRCCAQHPKQRVQSPGWGPWWLRSGQPSALVSFAREHLGQFENCRSCCVLGDRARGDSPRHHIFGHWKKSQSQEFCATERRLSSSPGSVFVK